MVSVGSCPTDGRLSLLGGAAAIRGRSHVGRRQGLHIARTPSPVVAVQTPSITAYGGSRLMGSRTGGPSAPASRGL